MNTQNTKRRKRSTPRRNFTIRDQLVGKYGGKAYDGLIARLRALASADS